MKIGSRRIVWRLKDLMAQKGITTVADLKLRLDNVAETAVSQPQLYKIVRRMPARLNTLLLLTLTIVLECGVEDLLMIVDDDASKPKDK